MTTRMTIVKTLLAAAASLTVMVSANGNALADHGTTTARLQTAIDSNLATSIEAELEAAESQVCGRCIDMVMALLDHANYDVREVAAWWFARRPAQMEEIRERSIAYLAGNDSVKARNAADVLGAFQHPNAIAALSAAAVRTDLSAEARAAAVHALGKIGNRSANATVEAAMTDGDAAVRARAVEAWLAMRGQTDAAPIVALVSDSDLLVRRAAAAAIGALREASGRVALEQQLANDPDPVVRRNAAWALGRIGDSASRDVLDAATTDESGLVRMVARTALRQLQ